MPSRVQDWLRKILSFPSLYPFFTIHCGMSLQKADKALNFFLPFRDVVIATKFFAKLNFN